MERDQNFENLLRPKMNQSSANEYMSKIRHKKSKSEPPLKFNYTNKPCIEFCLEAKVGFQIFIIDHDSWPMSHSVMASQSTSIILKT